MWAPPINESAEVTRDLYSKLSTLSVGFGYLKSGIQLCPSSRAPLRQWACDRTLSWCKTSTVFNDSDLLTFGHSGTDLPFYWRQCSCPCVLNFWHSCWCRGFCYCWSFCCWRPCSMMYLRLLVLPSLLPEKSSGSGGRPFLFPYAGKVLRYLLEGDLFIPPLQKSLPVPGVRPFTFPHAGKVFRSLERDLFHSYT